MRVCVLLQAGRTLDPLDWVVSLLDFAHPPVSSYSLIGQISAPFVFAANMFGFVLAVRFQPLTHVVLHQHVEGSKFMFHTKYLKNECNRMLRTLNLCKNPVYLFHTTFPQNAHDPNTNVAAF